MDSDRLAADSQGEVVTRYVPLPRRPVGSLNWNLGIDDLAVHTGGTWCRPERS